MRETNDLPVGWISAPLLDVVRLFDNEREPINSKQRNQRLNANRERYPYFGATGQVGEIDSYRSEGISILLGEDGAPFLDRSKAKAYLVNGQYWVNNHAHILRGEHDVDNRFICYQLNAIDYSPHVSGSTRLKLTQGAMGGIALAVAPAQEQVRIADKVDELFSSINEGERALERVRGLVERYRQSVLKAAVTGELTREWREQHAGELESGEALLTRILDARRKAWETAELAKMTAKGQRPTNDLWKRKYKKPAAPDLVSLAELPSGWIWVTLDQLSTKVVDGTHFKPHYVETGIPFISVKDVRNGIVNFQHCKFISQDDHDELSKRCNPEIGDLLVTKSGTIGRTAVIKTDDPFSLFVSVALVKPIAMIDAEWLKLGFDGWFQTMRQAVLKAAFSGQLIQQDPRDEPASALLERILAGRLKAATRAPGKNIRTKKPKDKVNA